MFVTKKPFFFVTPAFLWQFLFFYVPLLFIVVLSLLSYSDTEVFQGFTLQNYVPFLSLQYAYIIFKSLLLATVTSILCFIVGYPVAHYLSFYAYKSKNILLFFLLLPFWTNFLLHIYAWFFVLERAGFLNNFLLYIGIIKTPIHFLNSLPAVIVLMVYCYLPFMVLPIYSVLERFDKKLIEASSDLGANSWQTWTKVTIPLVMNGILSGFFLVFVPAFGEFVIPGLLGGERFTFVGTVISQYILGNRTMELGAAFTTLSCIAIILVILGIYWLNRKLSKHY